MSLALETATAGTVLPDPVPQPPMPPRKPRGAPEPTRSASLKTAANPAAKQGSQPSPSDSILSRRQRRSGAKRRDAVTSRALLLVPSQRRTWWWFVARCPVCGLPHLGRSATLDQVTTVRKLPCRHWVEVIVARTYGAPARAA